MEMTKEETLMLELLVDAHGLTELVSKLSYICSEKSVHVAEAWQDAAQAKRWMHRSTILDRCHVQLEELVD